ncbi:MAG TPA: hypothetical protein VG347_09850 [Verrucomicrobiae bacterium]|nr:hypothetical protein [Verrucomicrobiae bacterium]
MISQRKFLGGDDDLWISLKKPMKMEIVSQIKLGKGVFICDLLHAGRAGDMKTRAGRPRSNPGESNKIQPHHE